MATSICCVIYVGGSLLYSLFLISFRLISCTRVIVTLRCCFFFSLSLVVWKKERCEHRIDRVPNKRDLHAFSMGIIYTRTLFLTGSTVRLFFFFVLSRFVHMVHTTTLFHTFILRDRTFVATVDILWVRPSTVTIFFWQPPFVRTIARKKKKNNRNIII